MSHTASGSAMSTARFDTFGRLVYVNALFIVGTLGTLIAPAFMIWAAASLGESQLGQVAALELVALASGSLSGLYWQRRWSQRQSCLRVFLVLAIIANLACVILHFRHRVHSFEVWPDSRRVFLCAIYSAFLANTRSPGKVIAVTTFIQIAIEALFVFGAATVFQRLGASGILSLDRAFSCTGSTAEPLTSWLARKAMAARQLSI